MMNLERGIELIEKYSSKKEEIKPLTEVERLKQLLEQCAEEIENLYGRETELTNKIREQIEC